MNLEKLNLLIEELRSCTVGDPVLQDHNGGFEYEQETLELAVILKLVRAAQALNSVHLLCRHGLFVDMGALYRCGLDANREVLFMLENYPKTSKHVDQFLKEFFSRKLDTHLESEEPTVETKKIHNAVVRFITGREQDEHYRQMVVNSHKTFCGYVHASYCHILQMFGGPHGQHSFNISGIRSDEQYRLNHELVQTFFDTTVHTAAITSRHFGRPDIGEEFMSLAH